MWLLLAAAPVTGVAAEPAGPTPSSETRLITLGTNGGAILQKARAQPANLLRVNGAYYLVDAGNGVLRQLTLAGVPFTQIHHIFITHNHIDHSADWATLMAHAFVVGGDQPITVYGPAGTEQMRDAFLRFLEPIAATAGRDAPSTKALKRLFRAKDIRAGSIYADENVKVSAIENCHYHFPPASPVMARQKSYAFRFETKDKVIVFSGDTGPCEDKLVSFAAGADFLVHEVIDVEAVLRSLRARPDLHFTPEKWAEVEAHMRDDHSTPEVVGRLAAKAGVKTVILSHVVPGVSGDGAAYVAGVRSYFSGPVVLAEDLMVFD
jgi:ribonuclease BN (tRNA processing enzyme)